MLKQRRVDKPRWVVWMKCLVASPGPVELKSNLLLARNDIYRQFSDELQISSTTALLQMQGSGAHSREFGLRIAHFR